MQCLDEYLIDCSMQTQFCTSKNAYPFLFFGLHPHRDVPESHAEPATHQILGRSIRSASSRAAVDLELGTRQCLTLVLRTLLLRFRLYNRTRASSDLLLVLHDTQQYSTWMLDKCTVYCLEVAVVQRRG
jgi:hypothetical protein